MWEHLLKRLLATLVTLIIVDGVLTHYLIAGGPGREANPLLSVYVGEIAFLLLKIAGGMLCAILLRNVYRRYRKLALITAISSTAG